ncbi:hypothetical protein CSQ88_19015 [Iodobacter sp. BJB302]|nr:hypothetical protein CSQ88_19015 [Iodobacter sp. BJB302]
MLLYFVFFKKIRGSFWLQPAARLEIILFYFQGLLQYSALIITPSNPLFFVFSISQDLGSVDVSFTAAFGPVLGLNKEKIATWYEYHERFLTQFRPKNGLNPKG